MEEPQTVEVEVTVEKDEKTSAIASASSALDTTCPY